ncbi:unnamed protein product [Amoebophrya sp. A120]|nr:unnamed protein product [Amoebophrya sp. A120]|eukprot:GSA120T00011539001.1
MTEPTLVDCPSASWEKVDSSIFQVRGAEYLSDKVKTNSLESLYECYHVAFVRGKHGKIDKSEIYSALVQQGKVNLRMSKTEASVPEYLVVHGQMPCVGPSLLGGNSKDDFGCSLIAWFKLRDGVDLDCPALSLLQRMLEHGSSQRNGVSFKAIGFCETWENLGIPDAAKGYNGKPSLIADSLRLCHENNVAILEFDVRKWSYLARNCLHSAMTNKEKSKLNRIRIGYLMEGKTPEELPEQLLGCFVISNMDVDEFPFIDAGSPEKLDSGRRGSGILKSLFG